MSEEVKTFNVALRKRLQGLKKDIGAVAVHTGYHGTGKQSHRYQIWVKLKSDRLIDLWLDTATVGLGGVTQTNLGKIQKDNSGVEEVYQQIVSALSFVG